MLLTAGRLVTILGPGGAGKTRLAVEAAHHHRDDYRDGAWLVELASVTETAKVAAAVPAGIGLRGRAILDARRRAEGDDVDVIAGELGGQESVLVVDNCEHLVDAVAQVGAALLSRCPGLGVLATSREPGGGDRGPAGSPAIPGRRDHRSRRGARADRGPRHRDLQARRGLDDRRDTAQSRIEAAALNGLGDVARLAGRPRDALVHHRAAMDVARRGEWLAEMAYAQAALAQAHLALGDSSLAAEHYAAARHTNPFVDHCLPGTIPAHRPRPLAD